MAIRAAGFKEAVDAAWCFGVDQGNIDAGLAITKEADTRHLEEKKSERAAIINRAMKSGQIDAATVQKMKSTGYAEASSCFKKANECQYATSSKQQREQCERAQDRLCVRLDACNDEEDERMLDELQR